MFFEREGLALTVVDVARYELGNTRITHAGRDISALSFRFRGDATLISRGDRIGVGEGRVSLRGKKPVLVAVKHLIVSKGNVDQIAATRARKGLFEERQYLLRLFEGHQIE